MTLMITDTGLNASITADDAGVNIFITHVSYGTSGYVPVSSQQALFSEVVRRPISMSVKSDTGVLEFEVVVDGTIEFVAKEIGYWLEDGTLFAVDSRDGDVIITKTVSTVLTDRFVLHLASVEIDNVNVIVVAASAIYIELVEAAMAKALEAVSDASGALDAGNAGIHNAGVALEAAEQGIEAARQAQAQADKGVKDSETAQTQADKGVSDAATAQSKGEEALEAAKKAQTQADKGVKDAQTAQAKAEDGVNDAASAMEKASQGVSDAGKAQLKANSAYDLAETKWAYAVASPIVSGAVKLSNSTSSNSEVMASTPLATKITMEKALEAVRDARDAQTTADKGVADAAAAMLVAQSGGDGAANAMERANEGVDDAAAALLVANRGVANAAEALARANVAYNLADVANKLAATKWAQVSATVDRSGTVQLDNSLISTSIVKAATANTVNLVNKRAIAAEVNSKSYADGLISSLLGGTPAEDLETIRLLGLALAENDSDIAAINAVIATKADKAALLAHVNDKDNPHDLVKDDIGLGLLNNWPASSSVTDASNAKYAVVGGVKTAHDRGNLGVANAASAHDRANAAHSLAGTKWTFAAASPSVAGAVKLSNATNSASTTTSSTPAATKVVMERANLGVSKADANALALVAANKKILEVLAIANSAIAKVNELETVLMDFINGGGNLTDHLNDPNPHTQYLNKTTGGTVSASLHVTGLLTSDDDIIGDKS